MVQIKDGERLAKLEQKVTDLDKKVTDIASDVKEVKDMISKWSSLDDRIKRLELTASKVWIQNTASAIMGSVLTFLIISFLNSR